MVERSLQEAFYFYIEVFFILVLLGVGLHNSAQTPLSDITKAYLEVACTQGGFTTADINNLRNTLAKDGFNPAYITVQVEPLEALNVTETSYVKRGNIISLKIVYGKLGLIDTVYKKLGSTSDIKNQVKRYGMSEKY